MDNKDDDSPPHQFEHYKRYTPTSPAHSPSYSPFSPVYTPQPYSPTRQDEHIEYTHPPPYSPCSFPSPRYYSDDEGVHAISSKPLPSFILSMELRRSINNQTDVALKITKQLLSTLGKNKNMVYSPLSFHIGLGMIMSGTKGPVQDQFLSFLKSESIKEFHDLASKVYPLVFADGYSKGGTRLTFANAVWVEKSLHVKPHWKEALKSNYSAALNQVDFQTRAEEVRCEANSWVDKETNGLIKEILVPGSVHSGTELLLASALYFKGAWDDKFDESKTKVYDFHLQSGSSVKALFMTSSKSQLISVFDTFKVLKLQYEQGEDYDRRFCMCVFLPNATDGLETLVERISSDESIDRYIPNQYVPVVRFLIPKFKISSDFAPLVVLKPLGFSYKHGDLTEMVDEGAISLDMFQKSFIEVNEEGTEAAAVFYAMSPSCSSGPTPEPIPVDFVADHPFLYLIREEETDTIMFMGHVQNPNEET